METVSLKLDKSGHGHFYILNGMEYVAHMEVTIWGNSLTVLHTEIFPKVGCKSLANKLLTSMVEHARTNALKVIPFCLYVYAQFKRHPEEYVDLWSKEPQ